MIQNNEEVTMIEMYPQAKCFCPIGNAWYTNKFRVQIVDEDKYCDYLDVEEFIKSNIEGKSLTIESSCKALYDYFKSQGLTEVHVMSEVNDATHFPVKVFCGD